MNWRRVDLTVMEVSRILVFDKSEGIVECLYIMNYT